MKHNVLLFLGITGLIFIGVNVTASLEDDLILDFSQTQFSFIEPMDTLAIFKFKATNTGTKNLLIHFDQYCGSSRNVPVRAPQGTTPLAPGESMWFKILPEGRHCGYDPNTPQTINRTLYMGFGDHNNENWPTPEDNSFSLNKTIGIKVVDRTTLEGDTTIQGITVDEEDNPIPYVDIELGGYGGKVPVLISDANGHFTYSIAESPVYFLIAKKEGYRTASVEINGSNVQDSYTVTLTHETSPVSVSASLINSVTGNIGVWRCAATDDESKLLLVNGMENWEDEGLKNQSKLYLLDTNDGEILWTHDMGWESWSADITDEGRYVVFGTRLAEFQTGPPGFTNYIRLLNETDGSIIWEKNITTGNFPNASGGLYTAGMKFSHNEDYILVHVEHDYIYLLNRSDGSVKWYKWVSQNIREVLFTQDDQYVYVPSGNGWLYKLRVEDGSEVWKQWIGCWAFINGFDLSPDENYIAVGSKAGYLTVLNTSDGAVRFTKDFHGAAATCRFSPDGTKLIVGGGHSFTIMLDLDGNVLWRYYGIGCDIRWSGDGRLIFSNNGNIFDIYGTMIYDVLPGMDRDTQVGWVNSDATRFIFAVRDASSSENNIIEVYSIETSLEEECDLPGDNPPCDEVTLSEVVDYINLWIEGEAELSEVIDLINAWALC